ncbi:hypothetical protein DUNSADRAFT_8055 [Dunaliella salina]|uniref:Transmembrane protein 135 N-terminal domain-containing protein n=1 Tax=Dunaliella salina TaxID=3046 RepID=A0ABQ7GKC6_DUNSA|nr:hypothetical protein DUNSADRAFT_8055 [Dunaliella salina]|eukprot:KAF5834998.1 hypothetical protein DUNSADRAFT_8055 [Dunaliella salina]
MQESERHEEQSAFHSALEVLKNAHGGDEALYEQLSRSWQRLKTAAWRGGAAGLTLRGGLNVLSTLLFMLRMATRGKGKARPKRGLTLPEAVNDTLCYTAFLAALGGSYVFVDEGLAILLGKSRTAKWRALVAGAVAGHTLLLTGRNQRHHSLATYILLRGLTLLVRTGNKPDCQQRHPVLHALLAPTRMAHGDTALMCLASSQIIYSFIVMPATLPPSYARFIDKIAGKESFVWHGAREQAWRNIRKEPLGPLKALQATPFKHCTSAVPCEFWHPGQTCTGHAVGILPHAYARALGIYLPVYLVPALLVHRQKLLKKPLVLLPKVATGVGRSALFLATYIALTFGGKCNLLHVSLV